jgi:hypothetical protein
MYLAGGLAEKVDDSLLMFTILFSDRNSDYATGRDNTADANSRIEILHKFAQGAIVNSIEGVIAGDCWNHTTAIVQRQAQGYGL